MFVAVVRSRPDLVEGCDYYCLFAYVGDGVS